MNKKKALPARKMKPEWYQAIKNYNRMVLKQKLIELSVDVVLAVLIVLMKMSMGK